MWKKFLINRDKFVYDIDDIKDIITIENLLIDEKYPGRWNFYDSGRNVKKVSILNHFIKWIFEMVVKGYKVYLPDNQNYLKLNFVKSDKIINGRIYALTISLFCDMSKARQPDILLQNFKTIKYINQKLRTLIENTDIYNNYEKLHFTSENYIGVIRTDQYYLIRKRRASVREMVKEMRLTNRQQS